MKTYLDQSIPVLNVKDFGAIGDGTADDTAAFQKTLGVAGDSSGGGVTIFIPDGKYRMTKELKIFSNTAINCASNVRVIRDHPGYLGMNGNRSTEENPSNYKRYTGRGNIHISGGVWDGNGVKQTGKASIFHFGHGDKITFDSMTLLDVSTSHHVEFNACQNIHVLNCRFLGMANLDTTGQTFNEAIQLDISKRGLATIGADDDTPCNNVWIEGCYFGDSETSGSGSIGRAVGSHTATITRPHTNIFINNCTAYNTRSFVFRAYNWEKVSITNNKIIDCSAGINWRTAITGPNTTDPNGNQVGSEIAEGGIIANNVFKGNFANGRVIEIYGEKGSSGKPKNITVESNSIILSGTGAKYDGIYFNICENCVCSNNTIQGVRGHGIYVNGESFGITIQGNTLQDIGQDGIHVSGASHYNNITSNSMRRMGRNGVYVNGGECNLVSNNIISGVNGDKQDGNGIKFNHLRITGSASRSSIVGNTCRNYSTTYVTDRALYVISGCTNITTAGNNARGFKWQNGATGGNLDSYGNLT